MNKTVMWTAFLGLMTIMFVSSVCRPDFLSDDGNAFLKGFVNQELLAVLGVVVTITLASTANLHLELNKLQDKTKWSFKRTRRSVKNSAYSLIGVLALAAILVIAKPRLGGDPSVTAACNAVAIGLLVFSVIVLLELTITIFKIPAASTLPELPEDGDA